MHSLKCSSSSIRVTLNVTSVPVCENIFQLRYRYKPKWAQHLTKSSDCQRALDHFDAFYKPVFGDRWQHIRLALLSLPKHCAVTNKFSDFSKVQEGLERIGSFNILKHIRDQAPVIKSSSISYLDDVVFAKSLEMGTNESLDVRKETTNTTDGPAELTHVLDGDHLEAYDEDVYKDNLDVFVPPEPIVTDKDKLAQENIQMSTYRPSNVSIDTIPMDHMALPSELNAFVFPPGDVTKFSQPKVFNQTSGYYLMDASSFMPVLALNLSPSDRVLDLCAAPGGKSLLMLQMLDFDNGGLLHCNDSSSGRINRLKNVIKSYIPPSIAKDIRVTQKAGLTFRTPVFNKVLVDAPCNTDRHVVTEEDNNLFKLSRSRERLRLLTEQRDLLVSAIKSCVVGGSVVYSTCTLTLAQNDGVVQAAVEALRENTQICVAVQDLSPLTKAFKDTFTFYDRCVYGQLILPSLSQNFGPLYFAKLQRIK